MLSSFYKISGRFIFRLLPGLLFTIICFQLSPSCKPFEKKEDFKKLDTLQSLVNRTSAMMIIDQDVIQHRKDSIDMKLKALHEQLPDSGDAERKDALIRYTAIESNYKQFVEAYPMLEFDFDREKTAFEDLQKKVKGKAISEKEFDEQYRQHYPALETIEKKSKDLIFMIRSTEKDYWRTSAVINPVYEGLLKRNKSSRPAK
jgi:hypothetical protein